MTITIFADKYRGCLDNGIGLTIDGFSDDILRDIRDISTEENYRLSTSDITVMVSFAELGKEAVVLRKDRGALSRLLNRTVYPLFGIGRSLLISPAVPRGVFIGLYDPRDSDIAGRLVTYFLDKEVSEVYLNNEKI